MMIIEFIYIWRYNEAIISHGFEGVAMISLDDDWSAMRFRNSKFVGK